MSRPVRSVLMPTRPSTQSAWQDFQPIVRSAESPTLKRFASLRRADAVKWVL